MILKRNYQLSEFSVFFSLWFKGLDGIFKLPLNLSFSHLRIIFRGLHIQERSAVSSNKKHPACMDHLGSMFGLSPWDLPKGPTRPLTINSSMSQMPECWRKEMRACYKSFGINMTSEKSRMPNLDTYLVLMPQIWLVLVVLKALLRHAAHSSQLSTPRCNRFIL